MAGEGGVKNITQGGDTILNVWESVDVLCVPIFHSLKGRFIVETFVNRKCISLDEKKTFLITIFKQDKLEKDQNSRNFSDEMKNIRIDQEEIEGLI